MTGVLIWWWFANIDAPTVQPARDAESQATQFRWGDFRAEIVALAPAFMLSAFVGSVALGALTWMPTYVKDTGLFSEELEGAAAGVLLSLMILLLLMAASLFLTLIPAVQFAFMMVMTALSFGAMGLVLSTVPVTLASEGRASSAAGISTGVFSIAGGLASVIVDEYSWEHVFALWGVLLLTGAVIAWANLGRERPQVVG